MVTTYSPTVPVGQAFSGGFFFWGGEVEGGYVGGPFHGGIFHGGENFNEGGTELFSII